MTKDYLYPFDCQSSKFQVTQNSFFEKTPMLDPDSQNILAWTFLFLAYSNNSVKNGITF